MAPRLGSRVPRTRAAAAALVVVALLAAGAFVGSAGFGLLSQPTPETIYVYVPTPGQATATATATPGDSAIVAAATETATATAAETETASPSPSATPAAAPTRTPTHRPATATPTLPPTNLRFTGNSHPIFYCGLTANMHLNVRNDGPVATSGPTHVSVTDNYDGPVAFHVWLDLPVLAAGATYSYDVPVLITTGCDRDHSMFMEIDPFADVRETTHADNTDVYSHHVDYQGPDLKFIDPPRADRAVCGVAFHVHMGVDNAGTARTGGPFVITAQDRVGTTLVATQSVVVAEFPAHTSRDALVTMTVGSRCGVTHVLTITLDSGHAIDETHESNNTATTNYVLNNS